MFSGSSICFNDVPVVLSLYSSTDILLGLEKLRTSLAEQILSSISSSRESVSENNFLRAFFVILITEDSFVPPAVLSPAAKTEEFVFIVIFFRSATEIVS